MNEILYVKCLACDGHGSRQFTDDDQFDSVMAVPPPFCIVCDVTGFIESGLHTGQVETLRKELRDCYRMIDECVSLSDVMRNDLSEDLLNRARLEAGANRLVF